MKRTDFTAWWLVLILLIPLLLVACERPLQEDVTVEVVTTPGTDETLEGTPVVEPGTTTETTPGVDVTLVVTAPVTGTVGATEPQTPAATTETVATPPATAVAEPTRPAEDVIHTVAAGETLGRIAEQYGVTIEAIAAANNITNVHTLDVGQQLRIPLSGNTGAATQTPGTGQEQVHVVQPGDTLYSIGQRYGFTVEELVSYNNLPNAHQIEVGQQIRIPPGE